MIRFYYTTSSSSCRRAKAWLVDNNLPFEEINLNTAHITKEDFLHILSLTEKGTDELIAKHGKTYQALDIDFSTLSLSETIQLFNEHRSLLRKPLIVDEKRQVVGYSDDEIRKFVPRKIRKAQRSLVMNNMEEA